MFGEADHLASEQFQRPAGAATRRARTGGSDQESFLLAGELALAARPRGLGQRRFQPAFHETSLGAVDGRAADADPGLDRRVAHPGIGGEQDLGSLEPAGGVPAAGEPTVQFATFLFAEFHLVA